MFVFSILLVLCVISFYFSFISPIESFVMLLLLAALGFLELVIPRRTIQEQKEATKKFAAVLFFGFCATPNRSVIESLVVIFVIVVVILPNIIGKFYPELANQMLVREGHIFQLLTPDLVHDLLMKTINAWWETTPSNTAQGAKHHDLLEAPSSSKVSSVRRQQGIGYNKSAEADPKIDKGKEAIDLSGSLNDGASTSMHQKQFEFKLQQFQERVRAGHFSNFISEYKLQQLLESLRAANFGEAILNLKEIHADMEGKARQENEEKESLPGLLKQLIQYCSLFPSQYEFRRDEMVQLWMAEGFLGENQKKKMEDIGRDYFTSLQTRGIFVQSRCDSRVDFDSVSSVPSYNPGNLLYRVNPMKLSDSGNASTAPYFVAVDGKLDGDLEKTRHISLTCQDVNEMTFRDLKKCKRLRTLLVLSGCGSTSTIKHVPRDLFLKLEKLRTLNLSHTLISELPSSIQNAKSLRYLDLSNTPITRLPESISFLESLQTIKLRGCQQFRQLPKGMEKLIKIRHIDLDILRQLQSMPPHLGNLTDLQTLSAFLVGRDEGSRIGELKNLNDLRGVLRILRLENVSREEEAKEAALLKKIHLQRLEFRWSNVFSEDREEQEKIIESLQPHDGIRELQIQNYAGSKLPKWISNPCFAELVVLTLYRCKNCDLLPSIGQLPMLKYLSVIEMNEVKKIDRSFLGDKISHAFSKLEILEVDIMLSLEEWKDVEMGDFPSLLKLTVDSCPRLGTLPSLSWLKSLEHLELRRCPKIPTLPSDGLPSSLKSFIVKDCPKLEEWCRVTGGEDWRKVCHLPSIWLDCEEVFKSHCGTGSSVEITEECQE